MTMALFAMSPDTSPGPVNVTSRNARNACVRNTRLKNAPLISRPLASPPNIGADKLVRAWALWVAYRIPQATNGGMKHNEKNAARRRDWNTFINENRVRIVKRQRSPRSGP